LQKANVEYQVLSTRLEEARTKLGIDDNFDIIEMVQCINTSLRTGETCEDFYDLDDYEVTPSVPDFTQPPPNVDHQTGEILNESPGPKRKTKATEKADMTKLFIVKFMSTIPNTWVSAKEMLQLFPNEFSEKTMKHYLESLYEEGHLSRKNEYQRISATKTTKRHLYKFFPATAVK
jgi:hypothetical protein